MQISTYSRFPDAEMANICCKRTPYTPHHSDNFPALWAEVMLLAIDDLRAKNKKIRATAVEWFISNVFAVGSYLWCCMVLGYAPKTIRNKHKELIYSEFIKGDTVL